MSPQLPVRPDQSFKFALNNIFTTMGVYSYRISDINVNRLKIGYGKKNNYNLAATIRSYTLHIYHSNPDRVILVPDSARGIGVSKTARKRYAGFSSAAAIFLS